MPNLKDIRSRIASVKNTQQITRAMKMVSAAKLRRAQHNIVNLRPYAKNLLALTADIATSNRIQHPLLSQGTGNPKKVLLVVLTSDRGLCGGFNNNINRFAYRFYNENKSKYQKMNLFFVGRKGNDFFKNRGLTGVDTILNLAREISYPLAAGVAERIMQDFKSGDYDSVFMIYNEFKSAIAQEIVCEQLLPIDLNQSKLANQKQSRFSKDLIFEPAPELMIDELVYKHFSTQVYRCMAESVAAEHGARMSAMENATKNAGEMISSLTLTYNKLRQASITTELIEITSGAEALNG